MKEWKKSPISLRREFMVEQLGKQQAVQDVDLFVLDMDGTG